MHYYNDNDHKVCAWLRELIAAGELPIGDVDCRSIEEVDADELRRYDQCHFFAGIGGWPLAMRWAGLEGVAGVWTGSCPCQPLSCAGKRQGHADERHLWPAFHRLISERRPATMFGEQVASRDGREWFAGVRLDLEDMGYACGAADLCAAGVGAPHRRQRLFWVADSANTNGRPGECRAQAGVGADGERRADEPERDAQGRVADGRACGLGNAKGGNRGIPVRPRRQDETGSESGGTSGAGMWSEFDIVTLRDGTMRRVEAGTFPLADGIPGRVGLLRGYGNAIVPQVAAQFVMAWRGI